jgi:hypothetical protein
MSRSARYVFCMGCRHLTYEYMYDDSRGIKIKSELQSPVCFHPKELKIYRNFYTEYTASDTYCREKNAQNNCRDFEAKP